MKKILVSILLTSLFLGSFAQIPANYYDNATGTGATLKTALYNIISAHTVLSYTPGLWNAYYSTDIDKYYENDGTVLDIYSENPNGDDPYNFALGGDQCGTYKLEGDCYNREHSFPKSWFNDASPMYSDIFHIYPTDGKVNGQRSNWPYGEVNSPSWTSENGCKLGSCSYPGYSGTVFEPIDEFKGDLARTYFYMATCYEDKIAGWETNTSNSDAVLNGTSYPCYESWFLDMLIDWNNQDPVSQKEIDRNDSIYKIQGNRNPYIDHPEWVCQVFDTENCTTDPTIFTSPSTLSNFSYIVDNGPSTSSFSLSGNYLDGSQITVTAPSNYQVSLNNSTFSSSVNVSYTGETLSETIVYVKLVSGLSKGTYNGTIVCDDNGSASNKNVSVSGQVTNAPLFCDDFEDNLNDWAVTNDADPDAEIIVSNTLNGANTTSNSALFDCPNPANETYYTSSIEKTFNNSQNLSINFWYYFEDYRGGEITIYLNGTEQYSIYTDGDGDLAITSGNTGSWHEINLDLASVTSTTGNYTIKIEGISKASSTWKDRVAIDEICVLGDLENYPTLSVNPSSLTGYTYVYNSGTSTSQSFSLSGINLDGTQISITAPIDYEISDDNTTFLSNLNVAYTGSTISATPIYVRLKSGLAVGNYNNELVRCSDNGNASDITVSNNGEVTAIPTPSLIVSSSSITGYSYIVGNGPSTSQSFNLSGTNLDGSAIAITAPTDYEISDDNTTFLSNLNLVYSGSTLLETTIYVRLKSGLAIGNYNSELVNCSDNGTAEDITVSNSGEVMEVSPPELSVSSSSFTGYTYIIGNGPSESQSFVLAGVNLDGSSISLKAPTNYEISIDNSTFATSLNIVYSASTLSDTTIFIRLKTGLSIGTYDNELIILADNGTVDSKYVSNNGEVRDVSTSVCEDFDDQSGSSYVSSFTTDDFGDWTCSNAGNFNLGTPRNGASCVAINDDKPGAHITTPSFNTVGTVTFWYYQRFGNSADEFELQISEAGGAFTTIKTQSFNVGDTYTKFSFDVNSSSSDVKIRVLNDDMDGHLIIDDFCVSTYSSSTTPVMSVSAGTLVGYSYEEGSGPSNSQSFVLSGTNLDGSTVAITAPTNYEISVDNSTFFGNLNIAYTGTTISDTTIFVRLKAGLPVGNYDNKLIECKDNGTADTRTVSNYGEVTAVVPKLTVSPNSLTAYTYMQGTGPSTSKSFILSGTNLNGSAVAITAPTNFEISNDNSTFSTSLNIAYTGSTLSETTIYVRLKTGLTTNVYNNEIIKCKDNGTADSVTVSNYGEVTPIPEPELSVSVIELTNYSYMEGTGPSTSKSFILSGTNLNGSAVAITAPTNFEISVDNSAFSGSLNIAYTGSTISDTTIYVRLKTGLTTNVYNNEIIKCKDNGTADSVIVSNYGEVTPIPEPELSVSPTTISGFSYVEGASSSTSQSFSLSGINLNGSEITVSAPTDYEVSKDNSSFFASVNVSYTAPTLSSTTIYVRLKTGLSAGNYNSQLLTCSDDGAANSKNVTLNGQVSVYVNINSNEKSEINIYPNPVTNNKITISTDNSFEKQIVIYNLNGQTIKTDRFSDQNKEIELSNLNSGIYFIKIMMNNSVSWKKIIKEL